MIQLTDEKIHDIQYEKRFADLFSYNIIGPDKSNRWLIIDKTNSQVGFIQYKKLGYSKKLKAKVFGYKTKIEDSNIIFDNTRSGCSESTYKFDIKRDNDEIDHVEIEMGENPSIEIWSSLYGFAQFKIDYKGLYLSFRSRTENLNIEELIIYNPNVEYIYQINYCSKFESLDDDNSNIKTREILGRHVEPNKLLVSVSTYRKNKLIFTKDSLVDGTLSDMFIKHNMGIDAYNYFKPFIGHILHVNVDIIDYIVDNFDKCHEIPVLFDNHNDIKKKEYK